MSNIPFVDATPGVSRSTREQQLEVSRVRSYAATVGHRERKARRAKELGTSGFLSHRFRPLSPNGHSQHNKSAPLHLREGHRSFVHLFADSQSSVDRKPSSDQGHTQTLTNGNDQAVAPWEQPQSLIPSALACQSGTHTDPFGNTSKLCPPQKDKYSINVSSASRYRNSGDVMQQTFWLWSHGLRSDPFECIPGSKEPSAALALDYCVYKSALS